MDGSEDAEDYLVDAASQLKHAGECEEQGNFGEAFVLYKSAVGTLLSGVREDLDCNRRDAVRKKTAQYLKRAEEIYDKHLAAHGEKAVSPLDGQNGPTPFSETVPFTCAPIASKSDLRTYKVLGVVGRVLLVLDTTADTTCIVKIVQKSSVEHAVMKRPILPEKLPHVVRLLCYHETEDSILLVMEHASGGRLWSYIDSYVQNTAATAAKLDVGDSLCLSDALNVYAGKKFLDGDVDAANCSSHSLQLGAGGDVAVAAESDMFSKAARLHTDELVSNAKRLMEHVDVTLNESEMVSEAGPSLEVQSSSTPNPSRRNSDLSGRRRRLRSRPSDEAFFAPGQDSLPRTRQRTSTGGSLELQHSRVRHFSSVFRDLDRHNDAWVPRLPENCVRIWAGEIAAAVMAFHSMNIVCGDLKPENILLDDRGHILVTYFGTLPGVDAKLDPHAKDFHYVAPEVVGINQATRSSDWWSYGALLFELLTGKLLYFNPRERLGSGPDEDEAILLHPFFYGLDWTKIRDCQ